MSNFARTATARGVLSALACLGMSHTAAHGVVRELVHAYPPHGPAEVVGAVAGNRVLRTMQRYSMPAFTDLLALHVAHTLQGASLEPVAIRRTPRAQGVEAAISVSVAPPDGRMVLLASHIPATAGGMRSWEARGTIDLRSVALVATMPYVLVSTSAMPLDLGRLTARASAPYTRLLLATAGERTASHYSLGALRSKYRSPLEPVAYNGGAAALQAVAVQEAEAALVPLPAALPWLGGGRLRMLALADVHRHPIIPNVPTASEAGLSDVHALGWFAVFVAGATPEATVAGLESSLARGSAPLESQETFASFGLRLEHAAGEAFRERIRRGVQD
jgi:tripartite-type tricarboxylate transporter receptor subunit TctC